MRINNQTEQLALRASAFVDSMGEDTLLVLAVGVRVLPKPGTNGHVFQADTQACRLLGESWFDEVEQLFRDFRKVLFCGSRADGGGHEHSDYL